jgi:predicted house-cleaning NTP pyrophosphatase (Maf/HAM1 superfamily)
VLASASPRRRALLGLLQLPFHVLPTSTDETVVPGASVEQTVMSLAMAKAQAAVTRFPASVVVAADTLVEMEGRILGKPTCPEEAVLMLHSLRGRWHRVWTGVAVIVGPTGYRDVRAVAASVLMRLYSDEAGFDPVAEVRDCRANVMGLPLCAVHDMLKRIALMSTVSPVHTCPAFLGKACAGPGPANPGATGSPAAG